MAPKTEIMPEYLCIFIPFTFVFLFLITEYMITVTALKQQDRGEKKQPFFEN